MTQNETPLGKNHKGTQNKNYTRTTALDRSVVKATRGLSTFTVDKLILSSQGDACIKDTFVSDSGKLVLLDD